MRKNALGFSLLTAVLFSVSCTPDSESVGLEPLDPPQPELAPEARLAAIESIMGPVDPHQWEQARMVGTIHAQAMRDLRQNWRSYMSGPKDIHDRICLGSFRITLKYHSVAYEAAGKTPPARGVAIREVTEVIRRNPGCEDFEPPKLMSLFAGLRDLISPESSGSPLWVREAPEPMLEDTLWYGEAVPYMEQIESLWNADPPCVRIVVAWSGMGNWVRSSRRRA